jgi:MSHA pilin protein MshD
MCTERATQRGLSLVELVMFIAIVGIAIAGVLVVYNQAIRGSADPLVRKQAIAIAESLLGEVLMQPLSWCDPQDAANDPNSPPASGAACTGGVGSSQDKNGGTLGPVPATESRFSASDPFDNVADYNGYTMSSGIYSLDNGTTPITGLDAYSATVTVSREGTVFGLANGAVLRVDVLVSGKGETITITGYRFRHSPNATG